MNEPENGNADQVYHTFSLVNDKISSKILERINIIVPNNGLSSTEVKKLANMSAGDIIPLFVAHSAGYTEGMKIGCFACPTFNDKYTPVLTFTQKILDTKKLDEFGKLQADKKYVISKRKLVEAPANSPTSNIIDFMDADQLHEYLSTIL